MIWHWFLHVTGADNVSGPWYGFWSGFGSDITEFALFGVVYHKLTCHSKHCWRWARYPHLDQHGVTHKLCHRHHPEVADKHWNPTLHWRHGAVEMPRTDNPGD